MKIRIAGIINDSIVDGPGLRLTVFTQGCNHNCFGCHNPNTHNLDGGYLIECDEIINLVKDNPLLDGITISGGEPLLQPEPVEYLCKNIKMLGLGVLVYTGFEYEEVINDRKIISLLENVDILIDGKFVLEEKSLDLRFRGSKNQRMIDVQQSIITNNIVFYK